VQVSVSARDSVQEAVEKGTPMGLKAKGVLDAGKVLPDDLQVEVVLERLAQEDCTEKGWVLDAFPAKVAQAKLLSAAGGSPSVVLMLDVSEDVALARCSGRRLDPETQQEYHLNDNPPPEDPSILERLHQRAEDTETSLQKRLERWKAAQPALEQHYKDEGAVCEAVSAAGPLEDVDQKCLEVVSRAPVTPAPQIVLPVAAAETAEEALTPEVALDAKEPAAPELSATVEVEVSAVEAEAAPPAAAAPVALTEEELARREQALAVARETLTGCLKQGLAELCNEKPAEPAAAVRWLAHWLLEHNPNKPRVIFPPPPKFKPVPQGDAGISAITSSRAGRVLSAGSVLVADAEGRSDSGELSFPMPGASCFAKPTGQRIGCVGECTREGVRRVLEAMQQGPSAPPGALLWLSLREETVVFVQGRPHALRESESPLTPLGQCGGEGIALQGSEADLKTELLAEAAAGRGRTVLHGPNGEPAWVSVPEAAVHTPSEVVMAEVQALQRSGGGWTSGARYLALPATNAAPLARSSFEELLGLFGGLSMDDAVVLQHRADAPVVALAAVVMCMGRRLAENNGQLPLDLLPREPLPITRKHAPPRGLLEEYGAVAQLLGSLGADAASAKLLADDAIDRIAPARGRGHHMRRAAAGAPAGPARNQLVAQYLQAVAAAGMLLAGSGGSSLQLASREEILAALDDAIASALVSA